MNEYLKNPSNFSNNPQHGTDMIQELNDKTEEKDYRQALEGKNHVYKSCQTNYEFDSP